MSAQEPTLEDQRETLRAQIESFERILDALESQPEGSNEVKQRENYERQLSAAREKYAALPPETSDLSLNGPDDNPSAAQSSPSNQQSTSVPAHPIEAVAGRFVRLSDLLQLKIGNDNAFSDSTRAALQEACRAPDRRTEAGDPVIGPSAFLRGELSLSARSLKGQPRTLGEALVAHFLRAGSDWQSQLAALTVEQSSAQSSTVPEAATLIDKAIVGGELTQVLADAARLVREFVSTQIRVDVTYAIIAALRSGQGQAVFRDLGLIDGDPQSFFTGLSNVVLAFLEQPNAPFSSVSITARADAARSVATVRIRVAPEAVSSVRFVADVPETSLIADRLGMADDARALAEVMCLREPGPPLAIGLFGDWGSGKSTFMNMIESAVAELTARTASDDAGRATFVSKVVHIRFNAWHYNDANLWASITSEFFAQLRSGGAGSSSKRTYEALVGEVLARVESLDGEAARAAIEAAAARGEAIDYQRSLDRIEDRRRDIVGTVLKATVEEMVPGSRPVELAKVRRALEALGRPVELSEEKQKEEPEAVRQAVADMAEREIGDIADS